VKFAPISWENGALVIIDQTLLPTQLKHIELDTLDSVWSAICRLQVRGAPAIGVCAAFGVLVGLRERKPATLKAARHAVDIVADHLATSRPTAVNLFWALDRMRAVEATGADDDDPAGYLSTLEHEARAIFDEDVELCQKIGVHGATLIADGDGVLTHCNAGGLATTGGGTALSVMYQAHSDGRRFHVFADETRPLLQGARLTAWELQQAGIDVTLICDSMAAQVMREGRVNLVIVGADRVAANGDAANKIGTYGVAVLARAHNIPFYVAIPSSTLDRALPDGRAIPIEERDAGEVISGFGVQTAPDGVAVYNPAFDVTPAALISGIITESGILRPPYRDALAQTSASKVLP
jgi:methylthioribose-1-phosphate isomerase